MNEGTVVALALTVFAWAILANRLTMLNLSGPLVLTVAGFLLGNSRWGIVTVDVQSTTVHNFAELTLALLLFADASAVPLAAARRDLPLTSRLLGIGLPLAIVAGTVLAILVFPSLPVALAGLIGASLAPTDAALSAPVLGDDRLPKGVRRVLNVESGLNDGIATPVVTFCIAAGAAALGVVGHEFEDGFGAVVELSVGLAIGAGIGLAGGLAIGIAERHGWTQRGSRRLATLSLALLAFLVASQAGGNPFVSAFVGGFVFGASARTDAESSIELTEAAGGLLSLVVWFIFGAGFVLPAFEQIDVRTVLYALASLTVVRMAPVAVALLGAGQSTATTLFIGWFGPRGLASVVFGLLAIEELGITDHRVVIVVDTIALTIVFSIVAHGITARPLATRYVNQIAATTNATVPPSASPRTG